MQVPPPLRVDCGGAHAAVGPFSLSKTKNFDKLTSKISSSLKMVS